MRGPGVRLQNDVRRLWRCPHCGYERHAPATEVAVRCHCTKDETPMKLIEPRRKVRIRHEPLPAYIEWEELFEEDSPSKESVPAASLSSESVAVVEENSVVHEQASADPIPDQPEMTPNPPIEGGDNAQL